jgi:hypothetical protein
MAGIEQLKSKLTSKNGIAMANQFAVTLPSIGNLDSRELNVVCKDVTLPGRQVMSLDRNVGIFNEKIANGFGVEDVSITFYVLNDYGVKKYFDAWANTIVGMYYKSRPEASAEDTDPEDKADVKRAQEDFANSLKMGEVGYKNSYSKSITIRQLRKPIARFGFDLGPFDFNFDVGGASIYSVELLEAFPTSLSSIQLSNDGQLVECTMQFSYTNWKVIDDKRSLLDGKLNLNLGGLI